MKRSDSQPTPPESLDEDVKAIKHALDQAEECVGGRLNEMIWTALEALQRIEARLKQQPAATGIKYDELVRMTKSYGNFHPEAKGNLSNFVSKMPCDFLQTLGHRLLPLYAKAIDQYQQDALASSEAMPEEPDYEMMIKMMNACDADVRQDQIIAIYQAVREAWLQQHSKTEE